MAGHSLGEYTALVAAGALTPEEGARLVAARGDAMQAAADAEPGTMAAVLGLDARTVAEACRASTGPGRPTTTRRARSSSPGPSTASEAAGAAAKVLGAKRVMPLPVGGAFHSPLMAPAQARLDGRSWPRHSPRPLCDVVANVDAAAHRDGWARAALRATGVAGSVAGVAADPRRAGRHPLPGAGPGDRAVRDGQADRHRVGPGPRGHP